MMWNIPIGSPRLLISLWYVKRGWGCDPSHYQSVGERPSSCMLVGSQLLALWSSSQSDASGNISTMSQPCHPWPLRHPADPDTSWGKSFNTCLITGVTSVLYSEESLISERKKILLQAGKIFRWLNIKHVFFVQLYRNGGKVDILRPSLLL